MVLNEFSTHSNPWTPPTKYDSDMGVTHPLRIFHGYPKDSSVGPPVPSRFADGSLAYRLGYALKDGTCVGLMVAAWERYMIVRQPTSSAAVARAIYFTAPAVAASLSFAATRELLSRFVQDPYHPGPTVASAAVAGSVLGVAYKSTRFGFYATGAIGLFTVGHIYLSRLGYVNYGLPGDIPERKSLFPESYFIWNERDPFYKVFFGSPTNVYRTKEDVPTWKKFEKKNDE